MKQCSAECAVEAWPGPNDAVVTECVRCPYEGQIYNLNTVPPSCECIADEYETAAGKCIKNEYAEGFDTSNAQLVSYSAIETLTADGLWSVSPNTHTSGTMEYFYLDAAVGCVTFKDVQKCQLLANLCVLQVYNSASEVCRLYQQTVD